MRPEKRVDSIPTETVVHLYAREALVKEAQQNLSDALTECLSGSEDPYHWTQLRKWQTILRERTARYTSAIESLLRSQNRG